MFGELGRGFTQAAEVNDAFDPGSAGGRREVAGHVHIALGKVSTTAQAVHQVIGDVYPLQCREQRSGVQHIARCDLNLVLPGAPFQAHGVAHQAANTVAQFEQAGNKAPAYVAGSAGD